MQWVGIAIALIAMFGAGVFFTWLWQRRSNRVLREDVRKRVEGDMRIKLEEAQSLDDTEALQRAIANKERYGGGGQIP